MTDRPRDEHGHSDEHGQPEEQQGPIVRDKRRIDPATGALREPAASQPAPAAAGVPDSPADGLGDDVAEELSRQITERTADLQRVQAEYANYRRRVDRDREVIRETAVANVLANLLPVLDDIGRARDHGELEGGFKQVGEALEAIVDKLGLVRFGTPGEPFDPTVHEALTHTQSPDVTETTCVEVYQPGYRIGDRVVRPARVAVADPE
ncbi:MAG TPA: nucleotide exchange factor GrpE [Actinomycetes bacterium]